MLNEYLRYFTLDKAKIGLKLLKPVKKIRIAENLIDTEKSPKSFYNIKRTRIRFEFLKDPKYRIYFWHNDNEIYDKLKENLSKHKSVYTPCFGLSENIANFEFVGELDITVKKTDSESLIYSVIPTEKLLDKQGINFDFQGEYFSLRLPSEMNQERIITKYSDIIFERNGNPMKVKMKEPYLEINYDNGTKDNIVFIE